MPTPRLSVQAGLALAVALLAGPSIAPVAAQSPTLTFEERVAARRAIEEVYWRHRTWPEGNPQPKPALSAVLSEAALRARVDGELEASRRAEQILGRPIDTGLLRAEVARMRRDTRRPDVLAELFSALGDDPLLLAECLARPLVAERISRDGRAGVSVAGSAAPPPPCQDDAWTPTRTASGYARSDHAAVWTGSEMIVWGGCNSSGLPLGSGVRYDPATDSWSAIPPGSITGQIGGCGTTLVWTGTEAIVWGGGYVGDFGGQVWNAGGRYNPAANTSAPTGTGAGVPEARWSHTAVWSGTRMIVWGGSNSPDNSGGLLRTGGLYDPATDTWAPTSTGLCAGGPNSGGPCAADADCPGTCAGGASPGGLCDPNDPNVCSGGCQLDPAVACRFNTLCRTLGLGNCTNPAPGTCAGYGACVDGAAGPSARAGHTAVWTGSRMIVWGGRGDGMAATNTGAAYDPLSNTWTPTGTGAGVPAPRFGHTAVWTGQTMIVWGGGTSTGGLYDPVANAWTPTGAGPGTPDARTGHTAVWTGSEMIVWGGHGTVSGSLFNTGGRYTPATGSWAPTSTGANTPAGRDYHTAVWTGSEMIVWGGGSATGNQGTGARYCAASACQVATWFRDGDGDGFGNSTDRVLSCTQPAGYAAAGGDCDDSNPAVHPGAQVQCDGVDHDCDGAPDHAAPPAGSVTISVAAQGGGAALSWTGLAGAAGYDVVRGSLEALSLSGGDFSIATTECLANDLAATALADPGPPPAGTGLWYLIRGVNCGGAGSYDSLATSQSGQRDLEIEASPARCP